MIAAIAASASLALGGSIVLSSCAQVSLKQAANAWRPGKPAWLSPWLLVWAIGFAVATWLWVVALRSFNLSYAYPLLGLGYVLVTALSATLLHEHVSRLHWLAVGIIALGAACLAQSN